jgi:replication initiation and membrane attachment protein DnaB
MDAILIEPRNKKELSALKKIIAKLGLASLIVTEKEKKIIAGYKAVEIARDHPKYDISEEDILSMVKEAEVEIYGKK